MATKQFCDRCEKDITKKDGFSKSILTIANSVTSLTYDLCDYCRGQFIQDFMNPARAAAND